MNVLPSALGVERWALGVGRWALGVGRSAFGVFFLISCAALAAPSPSPPSQFPSDAEIKKLPKDQILATWKHQEQILEATIAENAQLKKKIVDATASQSTALNATSGALTKISTLTDQLGQITAHDAKMTNLANEYGKKLNWYRLHWWGAWIVFGLGVIACIVLAFLKFTGRLAILGTAVAAKVP